MRRLLASASLAACLPLPALAQGAPGWLDLLSPDRIVQSLLQSGVLALRSQADIKYGGLSVDLRAGRMTMTDLTIWPLPPWDEAGDCEINIDRLTLRTAALDEPSRIRFKLQALGAEAPSACFPEEPRGGLAMAGLDRVNLPRLTMDIDYDVPSGGADIAVHGDITDVAVADLTARFSYFSFDGRDDMEEPMPVFFLEHAVLSVENAGIWDVMSAMIPPEFANATAGPLISGMLGGMLSEANREAADFAEGDDPAALTEAQVAFAGSLAAAWEGFLENPERLVLETQIDGDVYLDFVAIEENPREIFAALNPVLSLAPAAASEIVPAALLDQALNGATAELSHADRRRLGLALVSGTGAPRNVSAGIDLLGDLAAAGDGSAALALSEALDARDPAEAYRWALLAGAAGESGAAARLDRLERALGMAEVLTVQEDVSGDDQHDPAVLDSVSAIREQAAMRLTGRGMARSYGIAAMWAMIGAAAGDAEAGDILSEIDDRMRMTDETGRARWAASEDAASALATEAWLSRDLPARFSQ